MENYIVDLKNVNFRYADKKEKTLQGINLSIKKGELVLITGRSGSGKTTISKCINGLIPQFFEGELTGEIYVNGKNTLELPIYEIGEVIGSVFQDPRSQFFTTNTTEEIAFGCQNAGLPKEEILERVNDAFETTQINKLRDRNVFSLSSGEKQKVAIASSYAMKPEVFIFDEPSSNLDIDSILQLREVICKLKDIGKTIIIVEHRLYYLKGLIDKFIEVEKGKIVQSFDKNQIKGISNEFFKKKGLRQIFLPDLKYSAKKFEINHLLKLDVIDVSFEHNFRLKQQCSRKCSECKMLTRCKKRCNKMSVKGNQSLMKSELLQRVKFSAYGGEVIGIIGKNGVGKTTLAKVIVGLLNESSGSIAINEIVCDAKHRIEKSFFVMQDSDYQLFEDSVRAELQLGIEDDITERSNQVLRKLELLEVKEMHPASLSRGQKQRLTIANAFIKDTDINLFDEPTSGLDGKSMQNVVELFQNLSERGKIIIVITHDYEFLISSCTRILYLSDGILKDDFQLNINTMKRLYQLLFSTKGD